MDFIGIITEYWPKLLDGALMTLKLTFMGALIAGILAPALALFRVSGGPLAQFPLRLYVSFARGTPLLVSATQEGIDVGATPSEGYRDRARGVVGHDCDRGRRACSVSDLSHTTCSGCVVYAG